MRIRTDKTRIFAGRCIQPIGSKVGCTKSCPKKRKCQNSNRYWRMLRRLEYRVRGEKFVHEYWF